MKTTKTVRVALLALTAFCLCSAQAQFHYTTNNGTITITRYVGPGGAVDIPGTIDGLTVTSIGDYAFQDCTSLTSVLIGNSVPNIGFSVFYGCASLTSVTIPKSVTSIGGWEFYGCASLSAITVEALNSFYSSVDGVLFNQSQTTLIQYPEAKAGSAYTIPNSVSSIGGSAFRDCTTLTSVTIPNSVTSIGNQAFEGCTRLVNITIPNSLSSIGYVAFEGCTSLTSVTIPNSVTSIAGAAFSDCTSLTNVTMGNGVTSIEGLGPFTFGAFAGCTSLTGVYFQGNAPESGDGVFARDSNPPIYYLPGATGWGTAFSDRPTAVWKPQVATGDPTFGVRTNTFGFTTTWASDLILVVEASTNMVSPVWLPVGTNTLTGGSSYFGDPQWTNSPARFYRLRSP